MAKTLPLAEKDESTYLSKVAECLYGGLPESYRDLVLGLREEGFSPGYAAYMVKHSQDFISAKLEEILK